MKRREELRSKAKEKAVVFAAPPPPPPLPPPLASGIPGEGEDRLSILLKKKVFHSFSYSIGDPKPLLNIEKKKTVVEPASSAAGGVQMKDIASGRAALRRVRSIDKNKVIQ